MKIEYMDKENIHGMTVGNMKVIGWIITWTVMVATYGKMAVNMKDSIKMTKNMDKVHIHGPMVGSMKECGKMEDNMVAVSIYQNKDCQEKEFGTMVKEKNGSILTQIDI